MKNTFVKALFLPTLLLSFMVADRLWAPTGGVPSPTLNAALSETNVVLSWTGDGFVLQYAAGIEPPVLWSNADLTVTNNGNAYSAVVPINAGSKYFRLASAPLPLPPTGLVLVPSDPWLFVDWNPSVGAACYNIYLAAAPGVTRSNYLSLPQGQTIAGVNRPYLLTGLMDGLRYYVVVTAVNGSGESAESSEANEIYGPRSDVSGSIYAQLQTGPGSFSQIYLPGVSINLVNLSNSVPTTPVQSDLDGGFVIPNVPPGQYQLCYQLSNNTCIAGCSQQQVVVSNDTVNLLPQAFTPTCNVAFGQVSLGGDTQFQQQDPFFGLDIRAQVKLVNALGQGPTNVAQVNSSGQFLFSGVSAGLYQISADCEGAHTEQSLLLPTNGPIVLLLPNNAPKIKGAYAQDPTTGQLIQRASPGATVRLAVVADDADGDTLNYQWIAGQARSSFVSSNSPSVLWQLPNGSGVHRMDVLVRDNNGGAVTGSIEISTDPDALFTGVASDNGMPLGTNVLVSVNGRAVPCDTNGYFSMLLPSVAPRYVLNIVAPGYETFSRVYSEEAPEVDYSLYHAYQKTIDASAAATITDPASGVSCQLPAGAFVDSAGHSATGLVVVALSGVDPALAPRIPGDFTGTDGQGSNVVLSFYAATDLQAQTLSGSVLWFGPGVSAACTMPAGALNPPPGNNSAPLWFYDAASGRWLQENGSASLLSTGQWSWTIRRTGMTAAADAIPSSQTACINLELDPSINLPANATILRPASSVQRITQRFTVIDNLPANSLLSFQVSEANGVLLSNACVISNSISSGPPVPQPLVPSNCLPLALAFGSMRPTPPRNPLAFRIGAGDSNYSKAYYDAIDPKGLAVTFDNWKAIHGFGTGTVSIVIYYNRNELGLGRSMAAATNNNGDISTYHSNYRSSDSAIAGALNSRRIKNTVCISYSPISSGVNSLAYSAQFWAFDENGDRANFAQLDTMGHRPVPQVCITCHGGKYPTRPIGAANLKAKFLPLALEWLQYSHNSSWTRSAQEERFRSLNQIAYLTPLTTPTIINLVQGRYAGGAYDDNYVPPGWSNQSDVWSRVISPNCISCHSARTGWLAFDTFEKLQQASSSADHLICGSHAMPGTLQTFNLFWSSRCGPVDAPNMLKTSLGLSCP